MYKLIYIKQIIFYVLHKILFKKHKSSYFDSRLLFISSDDL